MDNNSTLNFPDNFAFHYSVIYFTCTIVIAVLSPIAVGLNALIVAAIWKRTFQRTPFHILLSGLAVTDLCTGLIAQPLVAASFLLYLAYPKKVMDRPVLLIAIRASANGIAQYFIFLTLFIITLMSVERWLHMSHRSMVTSRCGYLTCALMLLLPLPVAVFRVFDSIRVNHHRGLIVAILVVKLVCVLTTSVAYFNVFRIIRRHKQNLRASAPSQKFGQSAINLAKYQKSVVTILYILGLFYICFLPLIIAAWVYLNVRGNSVISLISLYLSSVLLFLSSSLNPGLYLWRMNDIRNGVKQLFCSST